MKIIGISKIAIQNKITIIDEVAKHMETKPGDSVAFLVSDSGEIILQKLSNVEVKNMEDKK